MIFVVTGTALVAVKTIVEAPDEKTALEIADRDCEELTWTAAGEPVLDDVTRAHKAD